MRDKLITRGKIIIREKKSAILQSYDIWNCGLATNFPSIYLKYVVLSFLTFSVCFNDFISVHWPEMYVTADYSLQMKSSALKRECALCTVDWLSSIELNGEVTWARIVKSLSTGFILKSLALSTSHPCGFAPILPFSMCSSLFTSNVFLGAAEVIFGEIFTCFFAWYKKY